MDRDETRAQIVKHLAESFRWLKTDRHDERVRGEISGVLSLAETLGFDRVAIREEAKDAADFHTARRTTNPTI